MANIMFLLVYAQLFLSRLSLQHSPDFGEFDDLFNYSHKNQAVEDGYGDKPSFGYGDKHGHNSAGHDKFNHGHHEGPIHGGPGHIGGYEDYFGYGHNEGYVHGSSEHKGGDHDHEFGHADKLEHEHKSDYDNELGHEHEFGYKEYSHRPKRPVHSHGYQLSDHGYGHKSDHKFDHGYGHKSDHKFDHGYGHKSDHGYGHKSDHKFDHKFDHGYGHKSDHKFDHGYGHKSDHKFDHKFDHGHGHKSDHQRHNFDHKSDHLHGHNFDHKSDHTHGHKSDHIHGYGNDHSYEHVHEDKIGYSHKGGHDYEKHKSDEHDDYGDDLDLGRHFQDNHEHKSKHHGFGHDKGHPHGHINEHGYGRKFVYGHDDYKGSTRVEFLIVDSHGKPIPGATIYFTSHKSLGFAKTDYYGIVSVKIRGSSTSVLVSAAHLESKLKTIYLSGRYLKEKIALHKPANFRLLLQDPKTCKSLDKVLLKYKSNDIVDTVDTGKISQAHITVHGKKEVKAVTKKPYYETGVFESKVDPKLSPFASFSIPPKFKYGEFLHVILNYNPRKCLHIGLNLHAVSGSNDHMVPKDCTHSLVAPVSYMETLTTKKKSKIVITVHMKAENMTCISDSQARVTLYSSHGQTKTFSSVGMDPLPEMRDVTDEGLIWIVGCLFGHDLQKFIAINHFAPSDTDVNESICHHK